MLNTLKVIAAGGLTVLLTACASTSTYPAVGHAGEPTIATVVVLPDDSTEGRLPASHSAQRSLASAVAGHLAQRGYRVIDPEAVSQTVNSAVLGDEVDREGRIAFVRDSCEPEDNRMCSELAALVSVKAQVSVSTFGGDLKVRVSGLMIDSQTGAILSSLSLVDNTALTKGCAGVCVDDRIGEIARGLSRELTDRLAEDVEMNMSFD